ncbi:non-ribosomal peptide synthetase [Amycolatopsis sp. 195334CR]|uniref:non-ribosomal peptide synthetase n=1 Tax=Amycolatopsis sp. 195334CR TaxID=2814588 RepID=UPI001A8D5C53|nr:non-ribosomal peptide synthetase [Amycolatopsis sp. 195334CR]MBN6042106.1 amino acid adenylation domain-containing protein [Amycolatopsis sp. 195334CR]
MEGSTPDAPALAADASVPAADRVDPVTDGAVPVADGSVPAAGGSGPVAVPSATAAGGSDPAVGRSEPVGGRSALADSHPAAGASQPAPGGSHPVSGGGAAARPRLPLSFAQSQLWFLHQLSPGTTTYHVHHGFRVTGPLDVTVLRHAFTRLIARHESLRATFHADDGTPYQLISDPAEAAVTVLDRTGHPPAERDAIVAAELARAAAVPFDLENGPLARFLVLRLAGDDHALGIDCHHLVTDGWSGRVLNAELSELYGALLTGTEPDLPEPRARYRDFVAGQRAGSDRLTRQLEFWERRLAGLPVLELPADRPRPIEPTATGGTVTAELDPALVTALSEFCARHELSRFTVLATALAVVLSRYTGAADIPIGVPMHGRGDPDFEDVVGLFANMVVLRTDLSGDPSFGELAARVADAVLDLLDNQDAPFEMVVDRVKPVREPGRNPLFGVAVQVLDAGNSATAATLPGLTVDWLDEGATQPMFDLNLNFFAVGGGLRAQLSYASELFDRWRIEALLRHVQHVLAAVLNDPSLPVSRIPLLSAREQEEVRAAGRGPEVEPWTDPVHVVVSRVAAASPGAVAAICEGAELSYGELDRRARALAGHLRANGVRPGQIVAIALDRSLDVLVAMLAVWWAGAAFTVLDPRHPPHRLAFMLRDTAAPLLITRPEFVDGLPPSSGWQVLTLDKDFPETTAEEPQSPDALAYVLYTSGSTGRPKGVLIDHRALSCFLQGYHRTFGFAPGDRMLQLPAITFDMSQGEIWAGLTIGATLVLVSHQEGLSPEALVELIREERVTYAGLAPAMLSLLDAGPYPDLRYVMNGADRLPAELVNKWNLPGRRFVNLYGPTEAAVACTEYVCEHVTWRTGPPIGGPEPNRLLYVVDPAGELVPRGVPGELLIGGEGLARGYLNQPELTARAFVPDPFREHGRVYRSGDLVRWTENWQLEFLGRADNQVKLRGLRVELGEIEAALLTHPRVRMAVVLLRTDPPGEPCLTGYYTGEAEPGELRRHVADRLPEHMVPTAWVPLAAFPLTTARKVDRKALPAPEFEADAFAGAEPATATEKALADIFALVLGAEQVGVDTNFFDLGGNSLQAMRAVSRINKTFGIRGNLRLLYGGMPLTEIAIAVDELVAAKAGERGPIQP